MGNLFKVLVIGNKNKNLTLENDIKIKKNFLQKKRLIIVSFQEKMDFRREYIHLLTAALVQR